MPLQETIARAIAQSTGKPFRPETRRSLAGGCINSTEVLQGNGQRYFVKLNAAARLDMFEAEAAGLDEILRSHTVRVPRPVCSGTAHDQAYLVLEYLELDGCRGDLSEALLGRQLAAMHQVTHREYGWQRNNTIGSTPQVNTTEADWLQFYREHRLRYQLHRAAENGGRRLLNVGDKLLEKLPLFFTNYQPVASLLHGDLWSGNHGTLSDGTPVIFDPAVYYGDREADLAMTELFGGYGRGFYAAYREVWPLDSGYEVRKDLYNLYHVLNHFNLFGGGYAGQAEGLIRRLLSTV